MSGKEIVPPPTVVPDGTPVPTHLLARPRSAAPDATAGDGLREALQESLSASTGLSGYMTGLAANAVLALPALRDVLAAAARDAEKVRRVTAIADELLTSKPIVLRAIAARIRCALDPS